MNVVVREWALWAAVLLVGAGALLVRARSGRRTRPQAPRSGAGVTPELRVADRAPAGAGGDQAAANRLLVGRPVVHDPELGRSVPLRDWLVRHSGREEVWADVVAEFYTAAAGDAEVADYFTGVDLDELQRHFLAALTMVTWHGVTAGAVEQLGSRHAGVRNSRGQAITGEVWDTVIGVLAGILTARGVPADTLGQLPGLLAPLRKVIVVEPPVGAHGR